MKEKDLQDADPSAVGTLEVRKPDDGSIFGPHSSPTGGLRDVSDPGKRDG